MWSSPSGTTAVAAPHASRGSVAPAPHVTFVMEQQVGLKTFGDNLRVHVEADERLASTWAPITYEPGPPRLVDRVPLPSAVRGALAGRRQVLAALDLAPVDARFFLTQVPAALGGRRVRDLPYVLMTDITPVQYDAMADAYGRRADRRGPVQALKRRWNEQVFRRAAHVFAISAWTAQSIIDDYGADPANVEVLAPGVDVDRWRPAPHRDHAPLRVLFVGADFVRKGGPVVLDACRGLGDRVELHVVTRSDVTAPDGVTVHRDLHANSPELIALFRSSDVFVMPSVAEAFGQVVVEAHAVGLPAIVSAVGAMPTIIEPGRTGFVVRPGDDAAVRHHLERLDRDRGALRAMSAAARARAEERFDAHRNASRVVDVLREVVDAASAARPRRGGR